MDADIKMEEPDSLDLSENNIQPVEIKKEALSKLLLATKVLKKFYKCTICSKVLKPSALIKHQQICNSKNLKSTRNGPIKKKRLVSNTVSFIYSCDNCEMKFLRKFDLLQHLQKEHKDKLPLKRTATTEKKIRNTSTVEKVTFKCDVCNASFKSKYNFLKHCLKHDSEDIKTENVSDGECNETINEPEIELLKILDNAQHSEDKNIIYKCETCVTPFLDGIEFMKDQKLHFRHNFDLDDQNLVNKLQHLISFKVIVDGNVAYKCQECSVEYLDATDFKKHQDFHSKELFSSVPKQSNIKQVLKDSTTTNDCGNAVFNCHVCSREFKREEWFIKHYNIHLGGDFKKRRDIPVPCDICSKLFTRKNDMLRHRKSIHPSAPEFESAQKKEFQNTQKKERIKIWKKCETIIDGKKFWKCDFCDKLINNKYRIIRHREFHTQPTQAHHICEICAKTFRHQNNLNRHIKEIHENIKDHVCDHCGRGFKNKQVLKEHTYTHTDYRPYKCNICSKAFRQKSSLYVHNIFHKDEYRFSCNLCDFKCHRAAQLKVHSFRHTGERPHVCNICGVSYTLQNLLKVHMYTHSSESFPCDICGEVYKQPRYLQRHKRKKHCAFKNEEKVSENKDFIQTKEEPSLIVVTSTEGSSLD